MANKKSKLTMTSINNAAKKLNKKEEVELSNGSVLEFSPKFKETDIQELMKELQQKILYANDKNITLEADFIPQYVMFLCVKYFTHLKTSVPDEFEKQIIFMDNLINSGFYKEIIEVAFDPSELEKVWGSMSEVVAQAKVQDDFMKQAERKFTELKIANQELINNAFKIEEEKSEEVG
ncbi:hypothetical protein [Alkalihalobacillus sp. 1P02AB]|uniref:hypothetical protein n=1 Tax=Alkalihalobacillus sp. 1P02AB TaxID=3132260 RepID=UPI0039A52699